MVDWLDVSITLSAFRNLRTFRQRIQTSSRQATGIQATLKQHSFRVQVLVFTAFKASFWQHTAFRGAFKDQIQAAFSFAFWSQSKNIRAYIQAEFRYFHIQGIILEAIFWQHSIRVTLWKAFKSTKFGYSIKLAFIQF